MHEWTDSGQQQALVCDSWLNIALPTWHGCNKANEPIAQDRDKVQFKRN